MGLAPVQPLRADSRDSKTMEHGRAPWPFALADPLPVDGSAVAAAEVVASVGPTLTAERRRRIDQVVAARTFAVAPGPGADRRCRQRRRPAA